MAKTKAKRLLSLLLSLAMVFSLTVAPVYATDASEDTLQVTEASATDEATQETDPADETGDTSAEAESSGEEVDESGDASEAEEVEEADEEETDANNSISVASDDSSTDTAVASINGTAYNSLTDAIDAAKSGETVTLLQNVTLDTTINIYKNITLDLDNYTITSSASGKAIYTTQTLTINANENGGIEATGQAINNQKGSGTGTLTINGGTYTSSTDHAIYNYNGTVIVNSGTIQSTSETARDGICCYADATVTVNGGTISGTRYGIYSTYALTVANGEISGTKYGVYFKYGTAVTVSGGSIKGGNDGDGMVEAAESTTENAIATVANTDEEEEEFTPSITISGGTFEGVTHAVYVRSAVYVTGGTFTATGTKAEYAVAFYIDGATVVFSGGTFSGMYSTAWIKSGSNGSYTYATGYGVETGTLNDNNSSETEPLVRTVVLVSPVAQIGSDDSAVQYGTLQSAIDAAAVNDTVTLLADVTEDITVAAGQTITLNLNGCTLTNVESDTITVELGATLTITGTGTVDNITHAKAAIYNNGTVTLNGGTYTRTKENGQSTTDNGSNSFYVLLNHGDMTINSGVTVSQNGHYSSMIENGYQSYNSTNARGGYVEGTNHANPTLTINGGTFTGGLNTVKNDDGATLTITGGEFKNTSQLVIMNHSTATITGGTFTGETGVNVIYNCGCDSSLDVGVLTITGGTFTAADGQYAVVDVSTADTAKVTIENGTFTGAIGATTTTATWTVTGGSYSDDSADEYLSGTSYQLAKGTSDYKVVQCIVGRSIDLSKGVITMNVYIKGAKDESSVSVSPVSTSSPATVAAYSGDDGKADFVLSQDVYAKKMATEWTVTVTMTDDYVVEYTTSVKDYAETLLEKEDTTDAVKNVLTAMLDFGAAVQTLADYTDGGLANANITSNDLSAYTATYMKNNSVTKKTVSTTSGAPTLSSVGMEFSHNFSIVLTYNADLTGYEATATTDNASESYTTAVSGKTVTISGLSAAELNQIFTITVTKDSVTNVTNLSGLYYARLVADSSTSSKQTLGRTLYLYSTRVSNLTGSENTYVEE